MKKEVEKFRIELLHAKRDIVKGGLVLVLVVVMVGGGFSGGFGDCWCYSCPGRCSSYTLISVGRS